MLASSLSVMTTLGLTKHRHVVKLALVENFMLELRTWWILESEVKIFDVVPASRRVSSCDADFICVFLIATFYY